MLGDVNKFFVFKSLLTTPSNVLPLHLKQTFPPITRIFTEGEGDGIKSRLPFKIFSTFGVFTLVNSIIEFMSLITFAILHSLCLQKYLNLECNIKSWQTIFMHIVYFVANILICSDSIFLRFSSDAYQL